MLSPFSIRTYSEWFSITIKYQLMCVVAVTVMQLSVGGVINMRHERYNKGGHRGKNIPAARSVTREVVVLIFVNETLL